MRQSYYNVIATHPQGGAVVYNTRTGALARLSSEEIRSLENPQEADPMLANTLLDEGFLVNDPQAEAALLAYNRKCHRNNTRALDVTISPTRSCNCDCGYCYIRKEPGFMTEQVREDIVRTLAAHYEKAPFKSLKVNWYGGEPLLAIDVMEDISRRLMGFCADHNVRYRAHVLTNGILADAPMCERLVKNCAVKTVMPTISGAGPMHDYQRHSVDGIGHFDDLMANIDAMLAAGITVHANFVLNHNNFQECKTLAAKLARKPGMVIRCTRTYPYTCADMTLRDGLGTKIDLFSREEFGTWCLDFYKNANLSAESMAETLEPVPLYCASYCASTFFFDVNGQVYQCMNDMEYSDRALFKAGDMAKDADFNWKRYLDFSSYEPSRRPKCRTCRMLPICQGGCAEAAIAGADVCHDFKDVIEDLVLMYYTACSAKEPLEAGKGC